MSDLYFYEGAGDDEHLGRDNDVEGSRWRTHREMAPWLPSAYENLVGWRVDARDVEYDDLMTTWFTGKVMELHEYDDPDAEREDRRSPSRIAIRARMGMVVVWDHELAAATASPQRLGWEIAGRVILSPPGVDRIVFKTVNGRTTAASSELDRIRTTLLEIQDRGSEPRSR